MRMRKILAALAFAALVPAAAEAQTNLRLLSGFNPTFTPQAVVMGGFAEAVKKAGITIQPSGPEVVPPFEQFQPVSAGAFDLLFTVQPYHLGQTAVSFGLWALEPAPEKWRADGVWDHIDKEYDRHGLKLIAIVSQSNPGVGIFHALMKEPLKDGDFKGRKIRGNPYYKPLTEQLGGANVTMAPGEIYAALQRGVVDGAFWSGIGSLDFRWYEVAGYMTRPTFGYGYYFILANKARFEKLTEAERKAMLDAGREIEISGMKKMTELQDKEFEELKKRGAKETQFDKAKLDAAVATLMKAVWETAEASKASGDRVKAFRAFLETKGYKVR